MGVCKALSALAENVTQNPCSRSSKEDTCDLQALERGGRRLCEQRLGERLAHGPCPRALWKMKEQVNLSPKTAF